MFIADADFPFLEVLWTMIIFFAWVIWIWIAITVLVDVFRRHDIGGGARRGGPCSSSSCHSSAC
jgi:hypothetical protein